MVLFTILIWLRLAGEMTLVQEVHDLDMGEADYLHFGIDVAWDGDDVYVVENLKGRVLRFTPDFVLDRQIGGPGEGPGELTHPARLAIWDQTLVVQDDRGFSFFDREGSYLSRFKIYAFVTEFVFVKDRIYALLPGIEKPDLGFIFDRQGGIVGEFGEKPFYAELSAESRKRYDADPYYTEGALLSDGSHLYYLSTRFGTLVKFDLEGRQVRETSFARGNNDHAAIRANRHALERGRKKYPHRHGGRTGQYKETYKLFLGAALAGDRIITFGQKYFPVTDAFTAPEHHQLVVIDKPTQTPRLRLKTEIPTQGDLREGAYLHSMTNYGQGRDAGLLLIISIDGVTRAVTLNTVSP